MADQGRIVKMWFRKAIEDLQAAEKAIKGFLAFNKIRFSKTSLSDGIHLLYIHLKNRYFIPRLIYKQFIDSYGYVPLTNRFAFL